MDGAVSSGQRQNLMEELIKCPFCGADGKLETAWDGELFPSGKAVTCSGGCWVDGVLVDFDAWQKRAKELQGCVSSVHTATNPT